jgi:hypothetical protein
MEIDRIRDIQDNVKSPRDLPRQRQVRYRPLGLSFEDDHHWSQKLAFGEDMVGVEGPEGSTGAFEPVVFLSFPVPHFP